MNKIKNVVFDLGGVIITLSRKQAVERFIKIGVTNAEELIDSYQQKGIFLEVEEGRIGTDGFCRKLSDMIGRELSYDEVSNAWLGFVEDVPLYKLEYLLELRKHYRVYLLSNTNPFVMNWACSREFTALCQPLTDYFDKLYTSFEMGITKPNRQIFEMMLADGKMIPSETLFLDDGKANIDIAKELGLVTFQLNDGDDWRKKVDTILQRNV